MANDYPLIGLRLRALLGERGTGLGSSAPAITRESDGPLPFSRRVGDLGFYCLIVSLRTICGLRISIKVKECFIIIFLCLYRDKNLRIPAVIPARI